MKSRPRILLIDDELIAGASLPESSYMWYYTEALRERGLDVVEVTSADDAIRELSADPAAYQILIVDVLMDPGESFSLNESQRGMRTGVLLVQRAARLVPKVPVIVLTHSSDPNVHAALRRKRNVAQVIRKVDCTPFELADAVEEVLGRTP